ncbi:MSP domain-containing protein [Aphelenchoides besseyi]|nr:MSP domain-containing protein [Aphelenchoides besseyi]
MAEAALNIEPSSATFPAAGGNAKHEVVNLTDNRLGFKVKSSNNEHYRVKPVFGFVAPKGRTTLELIRLPGPPKRRQNLPAEEEDPQAPFKAGAACGEVILPLKAE